MTGSKGNKSHCFPWGQSNIQPKRVVLAKKSYALDVAGHKFAVVSCAS